MRRNAQHQNGQVLPPRLGLGAHLTSKCFLLPTVLPYIKRIKGLYDKYPLSTLLIVGHTDAEGDPGENEGLSLDRAGAMAAFLKDDVDAWLAWYESGNEKKRWGASEDKLMIRSMPDYSSKPEEQDRVKWYQGTRGLEPDGICGPLTRRVLVKEYMGHDGTTLPPGVALVTHGCGSNFPVPEPAPEDQASWDRHSEIEDRRVELFFFDQSLGIQPPPPGPFSAKGTLEYPEWQARTREFVNMTASGVGKEVTLLEMHDALFRSNSAVLFPEGEDPTKKDDDHSSLTTVGIIATLLRYNEEHPGKKMLIAGHCDTTNTPDFNQPLSEERAGVALALLTGERQSFIDLCDKRHDGVDVTQIFDWTTTAFGFSCKPTRLDAAPNATRYHQFRMSYNAWVAAWDPAVEPDPRGPGKISQWGGLDKSVWGAIFDLYEHGLREELGEDGAGVAELRGKIVWVDICSSMTGKSRIWTLPRARRSRVSSICRDGMRDGIWGRWGVPTPPSASAPARNDPVTLGRIAPGVRAGSRA